MLCRFRLGMGRNVPCKPLAVSLFNVALILGMLLGPFRSLAAPAPGVAAPTATNSTHIPLSLHMQQTPPNSYHRTTRDGWDGVKVIDPVVIKDGGLYKMWYSGQDLGNVFRIGYATSADGIHWNKYAGNPVIDVGEDGAWDSQVVRVNAVVKDSSTYRMWYIGDGHQRIGYATSTDGIHWTKYADNPVFDSGPSAGWDEGAVTFAGVIRDGEGYKMWYTGMGASGFGGAAHIGYATSPDGIHWTRASDSPVLDVAPPAWDGAWVFDPHVIWDGGTYRMWYSGMDVLPICGGEETMRIGLATSTDGVTWTRSAGNPVLDVDPNDWDSRGVSSPTVIFDGGVYHLWYHGGVPCGTPEMIGYATSSDGVSWARHAGNPVLRPGQWWVYLPAVVKR